MGLDNAREGEGTHDASWRTLTCCWPVRLLRMRGATCTQNGLPTVCKGEDQRAGAQAGRDAAAAVWSAPWHAVTQLGRTHHVPLNEKPSMQGRSPPTRRLCTSCSINSARMTRQSSLYSAGACVRSTQTSQQGNNADPHRWSRRTLMAPRCASARYAPIGESFASLMRHRVAPVQSHKICPIRRGSWSPMFVTSRAACEFPACDGAGGAGAAVPGRARRGVCAGPDTRVA